MRRAGCSGAKHARPSTSHSMNENLSSTTGERVRREGREQESEPNSLTSTASVVRSLIYFSSNARRGEKESEEAEAPYEGIRAEAGGEARGESPLEILEATSEGRNGGQTEEEMSLIAAYKVRELEEARGDSDLELRRSNPGSESDRASADLRD